MQILFDSTRPVLRTRRRFGRGLLAAFVLSSGVAPFTASDAQWWAEQNTSQGNRSEPTDADFDARYESYSADRRAEGGAL